MIPFLDFLTPIISKALDYLPDPKLKAEMHLKITQELNRNQEVILAALSAVDQKQADINLEEAKSPDKFKSYPRPLAMWACVFGLVWQIGAIVVSQFFVWFGHSAPQIVQLPEFLTGTLMTGLLGLGGYRYLEKKDGLTK
mgnify:CR=1 FL=1